MMMTKNNSTTRRYNNNCRGNNYHIIIMISVLFCSLKIIIEASTGGRVGNHSNNDNQSDIRKDSGNNNNAIRRGVKATITTTMGKSFTTGRINTITTNNNEESSYPNLMSLSSHLNEQQHHDDDNKDNSLSFPFVPKQFTSIDITSYKEWYNNSRYQSFPRWDFTMTTRTEDNDDYDSIIDLLLSFINEQSIAFDNYFQNHIPQQQDNNNNNNYIIYKIPYSKVPNTTLLDHNKDKNGHYSEILYVLNARNMNNNNNNEQKQPKMYVSRLVTNQVVSSKILYTEKLISDSLDTLQQYYQNYYTNTNHNMIDRWPRLRQLLVLQDNNDNNNNIVPNSIPILFQFCDYTGCNYHNYYNYNKNNYNSIPTLTVAANVDCIHTFPFPNYAMYELVLGKHTNTNNEWYHIIKQNHIEYPFHTKIKQIIWRGSLNSIRQSQYSNSILQDQAKHQQRGIRYRLAQLVNSDAVIHNETLKQLYNIKLLPSKSLNDVLEYQKRHINDIEPKELININTLGNITNLNYIPMNEYMKYRAIIDMDGYSWSSRFSTLLCTNSIILKIESQYVDYHYYPMNHNHNNNNNTVSLLLPWKHYIPIKNDLSDLFEKTLYVMNDQNNIHIQTIIKKANEYCATHFIKEYIQYDSLDIIEKYINILDQSNHIKNNKQFNNNNNNNISWEQQWNEAKNHIFNNGPLQMTPVL